MLFAYLSASTVVVFFFSNIKARANFIHSKNNYKIISLFQASMPAYCLEKLSYSCYKLRKKYNRNADIPITMAVLAGTSVLSVDTAASSLQLPDNAV